MEATTAQNRVREWVVDVTAFDAAGEPFDATRRVVATSQAEAEADVCAWARATYRRPAEDVVVNYSEMR